MKEETNGVQNHDKNYSWTNRTKPNRKKTRPMRVCVCECIWIGIIVAAHRKTFDNKNSTIEIRTLIANWVFPSQKRTQFSVSNEALRDRSIEPSILFGSACFFLFIFKINSCNCWLQWWIFTLFSIWISCLDYRHSFLSIIRRTLYSERFALIYPNHLINIDLIREKKRNFLRNEEVITRTIATMEWSLLKWNREARKTIRRVMQEPIVASPAANGHIYTKN